MPRTVSLGPRRNPSVGSAGIVGGGGLVRPNTRPGGFLRANGSGALIGVGETQFTAGTITNLAPTAAVPWMMEDFASAATLNSQGLGMGAGLNYRWSQRPLFQMLAAPGSVITVARYWGGLFNTSFVTLLGVDTPGTSAISGAGFRFSTAVPDTTWKCVTCDGASQTVVDSGVTVVASVAKRFEITDDGAQTVFKIDGAVVATITTTRPAATVVVRQGFGVQTLEAVAKSASVGWLYTETD